VEPARDAYAACLKIAPEYLGARVALAHVKRMTGDVKGAIAEAMMALDQAPGDPDALYAVALAQHARGDDEATKKYLEAFLSTNPEFEVAAETRALLATLPGGDADAGRDEDD
ncbi:MAG: tetratricopeptide repeat protein, partial [Polyangiaceae bacterium]